MNNSFLSIEHEGLSNTEKDMSPILREEEGRIVRILEALKGIKDSKDWSTLKTEIFDKLAENLRTEIHRTAISNEPNDLELRFLTGQFIWAERYSNLSKMEAKYLLELSRIRKQLYGKKE